MYDKKTKPLRARVYRSTHLRARRVQERERRRQGRGGRRRRKDEADYSWRTRRKRQPLISVPKVNGRRPSAAKINPICDRPSWNRKNRYKSCRSFVTLVKKIERAPKHRVDLTHYASVRVLIGRFYRLRLFVTREKEREKAVTILPGKILFTKAIAKYCGNLASAGDCK